MNFSDLFKYSLKLASFSPTGLYLASVSQYRLLIRDVKSLQIVQMYTCLDTIQDVKWSPDSMFMLCVMRKRGVVQVWSLEHPEWICKIDEGSAGLLSACWAPDSRHVLTTADFHLRITLWSLADKSVSYMKHPKNCSQNISFSSGGKYLALAERRQFKDYVSLLDCSNWQLVKHFPVSTEDLDGLEWSPDARSLAVWESNLRHRVCLYGIDGQELHSFSAYDMAEGVLGVKSVSWCPTGQLLAIGSYDQKCRILNHINWRCLAELSHPTDRAIDPSRDSRLVVYREVLCSGADDVTPLQTNQRRTADQEQTRYEVVHNSLKVPYARPDPSKANPKIGVGLVLFSPDNRYLVTRNDNQASTVWIWDVPSLSLTALLMHRSPVKHVAWDPLVSGRLALVTGSDRVYMWSPKGCLSVQVPTMEPGFKITHIVWQPRGTAILLTGDTDFCVCFLDNEGDTDVQHHKNDQPIRVDYDSDDVSSRDWSEN